MRLTSGFFVSALLRQATLAGGFAAVLRRGAEEAGAVFIVVRARNGGLRLFRPAPQSAYDGPGPEDRLFTPDASLAGEEEINRALERETRFDPDVWILEVEIAGDDPGALIPVTMP